MANSFGDGVWTLDTQDQTKLIADTGVSVKKIVWKPSAGAQTLIIKNRDGDEILNETSIAAYPAGRETYDFNPSELINGFMLHTLTVTGKIVVYLG